MYAFRQGIAKFVLIVCLVLLANVVRRRLQDKERVEVASIHRTRHRSRHRTRLEVDQLVEEKRLSLKWPKLNHHQFRDVLTAHASSDNVIILSFIDASYLDMALNFYETSLERLAINNYLFLSSDNRSCSVLMDKHINCYVYQDNVTPNSRAAVYGTDEFNSKMKLRSFLILDALTFGFNVVHSDADVVFFRNPLPDLRSTVKTEFACLRDIRKCNAGFVFIKPSRRTVLLYETMIRITDIYGLDDQEALNMALDNLAKRNGTMWDLAKVTLDEKKYKCGERYFQLEERHFGGQPEVRCGQCVVVHNNWIVGKEAKRYRFREAQLWMYDEHGYYSDVNNSYLLYANRPISSRHRKQSVLVELDALKTALYLGKVLDRIVILPRFHLPPADLERPLNSLLNLSAFDHQFHGQYRESTFLLHPKVPASIKSGLSKTYWIGTELADSILGGRRRRWQPDVAVRLPADSRKADTREVLQWFGADKSPVLRFHSLYAVFGHEPIPDEAQNDIFADKLKTAFHTKPIVFKKFNSPNNTSAGITD